MLRTYAPMASVLLLGCESYSKLPPTTQKITSRHTFVIDAFPTDSLKQLLGFEPHPFFERPFKGYYCAKSTQKTLQHFDGPFEFYFNDSSSPANNDFYNYNLTYKGNFLNGKFHGPLMAKLHYDDGREQYQSWTITLHYFDNKCQYALFEGQFGKHLPKRTYAFYDLPSCSFSAVEKSAINKWNLDGKKINSLIHDALR